MEHALHGCGLGPSAGDGRGGEARGRGAALTAEPRAHQRPGAVLVALADRIAQGELRPLHHPEDSDDLRIGAAQRTFLFR